jgi:hypothetical protein
MEQRETVRCHACALIQFKGTTNRCRRCRKELATGTIEVTSIIYVGVPAEPKHDIVPLREVMRAAAVHAVTTLRHVTKAAKALGITHERIKQLLKEAGDEHGRDRRKDRKKA